MIEMLMGRLFTPRYPRRYVGKHRAATSLPQISFAIRRPRGALA